MASDVIRDRAPRAEVRSPFGRLAAWWSGHLFAGAAAPPFGWPVRIGEIVLLLAAGLLFFSRLDCPLQEPEESLYAEVPRQMLAEGRVLVPVRHGQAYYDKPPLLYWLVMAAYQVCGVHDWAARLVPSGAALLCVVVTYLWGKWAAGPRAAFAGALMLCLAPHFTQMGPMLTTNALLTLWVIAALAAGHRALAGPVVRQRWWLLSATACGLGLLTKGPVALVLVAAPLLCLQLLDRRGARPKPRPWLAYLAVAGAVAVPWFVIVALRDPGFVHYFVWTHHIRRFLDPIDHLQPAWYYAPYLLLRTMPWALLLPGLVVYLARPAPAGVPARPAALGFFLLAGLWSVAFFSASGCKRPSYILPAMPPLALALGCYVDAVPLLARRAKAAWGGSAAITFVVLFVATVWLLPGYARKYSVREHVSPHVEACAAPLPVLCYPHGWDGVSFYLQRNDVQIFRQAQLAEFTAAVGRQPRSLVIVKSGPFLDAFLRGLPPGVEFVTASADATVTVGWAQLVK